MKHEGKTLPGDIVVTSRSVAAGEVDWKAVRELQRGHAAETLADMADKAYEEYWRTPWWKFQRRRDIASRRRTLIAAKQVVEVNRWYDSLPVWTGEPIPGCHAYRSR